LGVPRPEASTVSGQAERQVHSITPIERDDQIEIDGELVVVRSVAETASGFELVVKSPTKGLIEVFLRADEVANARISPSDADGNPDRALTGLWAAWMRWAVPRIRSAVLATRPLRPYAHQDDAVFGVMLGQPRLRFLLADEPGTGKTLMTGMYLVEARRRGLVTGRTLLVVPAHLVEKWIREFERFFGLHPQRLTTEVGRDPLDLRTDVDIWIVSVDLYTYNPDVRRKIVSSRTTWSLVVFDEAHRLTPTSQYLGAAAQVAANAHHLLLLTATPHRGKEHYFRALLHLLDPQLYPWDDKEKDYADQLLRPGRDNFLRRMKEDLRDLDGEPLFTRRFAETRPITLEAREEEAYQAVMEYVETWYHESILPRSIYGKRAASSITAVLATLQRRAAALEGTQTGKVSPFPPTGFDAEGFAGADVDSDEAWDEAENAVVEARSADRRGELAAVRAVITQLEALLASDYVSTKWIDAQVILARHAIRPGSEGGQLLVFSEFKDTARWLAEVFARAGYSTEFLHGDVPPADRDILQQRFLAGQYQVLISTDAGGEGIDLQSAHVMIDWDIPWSLVRLEQRAGRLHRIGQTEDVFIYHLVAPATREGRVQEVMLDNLTRAAEALKGRIYDLLDATAERAGFDFAAALAAAQRGEDAADNAAAHVPTVEVLVQRAAEIAAEEDRLKTPVDTTGALERFARDRLQAINPVIVAAFLDQVARTSGWKLSPGPATGIKRLRAAGGFPPGFAASSDCLVAADGASVAKAREQQFRRANEVVVLGPTEEAFSSLVEHAARLGENDLYRGAALVDRASLTDYTLLVYSADIEHYDGVQHVRRSIPFLIRYSGAGAFEIAWESLINLAPGDQKPNLPHPAARLEAEAAVRVALDAEVASLVAAQRQLTARTRNDLDDIERRYKRQVRAFSPEARRLALERFADAKAQRLAQLDGIDEVSGSAARRFGWLQVAAGARTADLGYDPDAEHVAVSRVVEELERLGWMVDDRQTAGLGYDLFARRPGRPDQRLVEVKGFAEGLSAVTLEQHEWAQAQQRASDYWLYVVINCATEPSVIIRCQDPASTVATGPKVIERFQIPVSALRKLMEEQ
jgi:superfamily II DNA or RNA helicase